MLIQHATVLVDERMRAECHVRVDAGRIVEIGRGLKPAAGEQVLNAADRYLLPGLIDLHTHGLQTILAQDGDWSGFGKLQLAQGVTSCVPTLFADPDGTVAAMHRALEETRGFAACPNLLGFRLEMPYVAKAGAGLAAHRAGISPDTTARLYQAARGHIRIWDVSPELPGAIEFIRWAASRGIVTSLAHSAASIAQAREAVDAGLCLVTHFFDTFDVPQVVDLGVYPAGLTDYILVEDRVAVEIIPDGVHVHPLLVEKTLRCKQLRNVAFITDSVKGAGSPPGIYSGLYPGVQVEVTADRGVRRISDDALSGSTLTQMGGLRNAVQLFGRALPEASVLCSRTPARILGLERKGAIAPGMDADLIILDRSLALCATILGGEIVHGGGEDGSPS